MSSAGPGSEAAELRASLLAVLDEKVPRVDRDRVAACFDFAAQAHGAQRRASGQPYISHPVAVCRILIDLLESRLDTTLACAALLHDVVEDTSTPIAEVEKRFGHEVARAGRRRDQDHRAALRQPRGPAGRELPQDAALDGARTSASSSSSWPTACTTCARSSPCTAEQARADRPRDAGRSTRRSPTGSASRGIKWELEDLASSSSIRRPTRSWPSRIAGPPRRSASASIGGCGSRLAERLQGGRHPGRGHRPAQALLLDLRRRWTHRGATSTRSTTCSGCGSSPRPASDCYRVLGVVHDLFTPVHGALQGLHRHAQEQHVPVAAHHGARAAGERMVEIQIRTREMHRIAEIGIAAHYALQGGRQGRTRSWTRSSAGSSAQTTEWQARPRPTTSSWTSCASPSTRTRSSSSRRGGELKRLPNGATPLDFAYAIHTAVGSTRVGARVNGGSCRCGTS